VPAQGVPLGVRDNTGCAEGSWRSAAGTGVLLYTDGLIEARHENKRFGRDAVSAALEGLHRPSPTDAIAVLRARVAEFAYGTLTDDLCLLAARIN
jgi:serine phosphatase RsbU (regulator of sigma subunit)